MKKTVLRIFSLVLLMSLMASPVIAQTVPGDTADFEPPEEFEKPERPEPEKVPQEIMDKFEDGMSIEEFLVWNEGPIPNALLEYADTPVVVIVQLEGPSLIEYVVQEGLDSRSSVSRQTDYVAELEATQAALLSEITAGRSEITQIGDSFTKVLNGFMLSVPAKSLQAIREIDGVKAVTKAPEHKPTLATSVPLINADDVWDLFLGWGFTGDGVTIAVIDSGIDYTHAMLGGTGIPADYAAQDPDTIADGGFPNAKVIGGYDFAGTDYNASGDPPFNIPVPDDDPLDEGGHGTHVASTAAGWDVGFGSGVAPDALLYALKVFGAEGSTNLTFLAIEWAMDPLGLGHLGEPVDVINMSLGADWGPADVNDPEYIAVENASAIGVTVVTSAGNAGDHSYIVGSPGAGDSAIAVAASTTGFSTSPYIEYGSSEYIPYTTSYNPFESTITADLVDVANFDLSTNPETYVPEPGTLCNNIEGLAGNELSGKIALISRGTCSFYVKINNAEALGAVAAIIYNNAPGIINMDTSGSTLPAGSITAADGATLIGFDGTTVSVGPDSNVRMFVSDAPADTIADFSSRGPRGFDSKLKPEITAPGVAIFAADIGTGVLGTSKGGTSMAAPHVAGVAALLVETHPGWDPIHIKAAMMNSAVDLADPYSAQIPLQGAGRVDALDAVAQCVVAYADPKLVSLTWGLIELKEDYSDTQTITLSNYCGIEMTFDVATTFTSDDTGATLTSAVTSVTVPADGAASVDVTLDLVAADMPIVFGSMEEYYGFVNFTHFIEGDTRVPFHFVPRPYTELTLLDAQTRFEIMDYGWVDFASTGPVPSDLWPYPVSLVSDNDPFVLDHGDLRYVGMDYGWPDATYGDIFVPAFARWDDIHTNQPYFSEVDLYIDADRDGIPETLNFNFNLSWWNGGDGDNTWVVIQVDFVTSMLYLGSPYTIYADFNSGFQEWYLPAAFNYVFDTFDYEVVSWDWYGYMDYAGASSFVLSRDGLQWYLDDFAPFNDITFGVFWVDDWYAYEFEGTQGIMLVDYHGKPGVGQAYFLPLEVYFNTFLPSFAK